MELDMKNETISTLTATIDDLNSTIQDKDSEMGKGDDDRAQLKQDLLDRGTTIEQLED